jgi:hypothetical protein
MSSLKLLQKHKIFRQTHDPIWQLQLGVLVIMALQYFTSNTFLPYDKTLILVFEGVLLIALTIATSEGYSRISHVRRFLTLILIAIVAVINTFSLIFLIQALLVSNVTTIDAHNLLFNGLTIYVTNIFMLALWYWEMDGGGPDHRVASERRRDFLFPQMIHPGVAQEGWLPGFMDYMYLSTTNVTNFASADTIPISHRAKLLMMIQALASLATVVLVAARAIGILQ